MTTNPTQYWFFVRGLMREFAHWENFPQQFEQKIPGAKVYGLDLPGSGRNWNSQSPLTVTEMARDLRREFKETTDLLFKNHSQKPPCYLLAISLGGMVALEWLQAFPEDLQGAVFINISLSGINPVYQRLKTSAWLPMLKILATSDVQQREKKVLELTTSQFVSTETSLKRREEAFRQHPATRINFLRQLVAASRFQPKPVPIKAPVLLLRSQGDRLVDANCSAQIGAKWNWEVKTHPTANHDLPLDDPQWVLTQIEHWLQVNINQLSTQSLRRT